MNILYDFVILACGVSVGIGFGAAWGAREKEKWRSIAYSYKALYEELVAAAKGEK